MSNYEENDDDVVVNQNQQLQSPKIPAEFTLETYQPFSDYLKLKYYENEDVIHINKQKELDYVFSLGIEKAKNEFENPILFEEKKPRKDVMCNLVKIANEFRSDPKFPKIKSMTITKTLNKVMGSKDKRTKAKYHKCVQLYVTKPGELGIVDVSNFVNRVPNRYLNTTSSTSSFGEKDE